MSESARIALVVRGVVTVILGTLAAVVVYEITQKYRNRYPIARIAGVAIMAASGIAMFVMSVLFMASEPYRIRTWLPLLIVITLQLFPRRSRWGFWDDLSARVITVAACCFTISELLFAWWR